MTIVENGVLSCKIGPVWIKLDVNVLGLDRDDTAVVTGERDFRRGIVCDCSERQQVRLTFACPLRPKASDQHVLRRVWLELENEVFFFLAFGQLTSLDAVTRDVFIKRADQHHAVCVSEEPLPEPFKVISPALYIP